MPLPTWKCKTCEKSFTVGEWICIDGHRNHIVESKEYLLADAPSDAGHPEAGGMDSKKDGRTIICGIPPDKTVKIAGELHTIPGGSVQFIRGRFSTTDPESQYALDIKGGWCSEAEWRNAWLSDGQRLELDRQKLRADQQRLENDRNELLSQQKELKRQPAASR
jgi:hypothetical protein